MAEKAPKFNKSVAQQAAWKLINRDNLRLETIPHKESRTKQYYSFKVRFWKNTETLNPFGDVAYDGYVQWYYRLDAPEEDTIKAILNTKINGEYITWQCTYDGDDWTRWEWVRDQ